MVKIRIEISIANPLNMSMPIPIEISSNRVISSDLVIFDFDNNVKIIFNSIPIPNEPYNKWSLEAILNIMTI